MDIKLILSSAVISAVISGCVAVLNFKRQNNLQYITGERKVWREEIRTIAQELNGASYKETLDALVRLKMRINAFGNRRKEMFKKIIAIKAKTVNRISCIAFKI